MRWLTLWVLAVPLAARAHFISFDFVTPSGVGTRTDGGASALQWVDGSDPQGLADLTFFASRTGLAPFAAAPRDVQIGPSKIAVNDVANVVAWNASQVPPGCYQPFAVLTDQIEGETVRPSEGVIAVAPVDGGNLPPALWILNPQSEKPSANGMFALRLKIEDPDDLGELSVRWSNGADAGGTIVQGLPTPDGGGTITYAINARGLPPANVYYLQAEVKGFDGQRCSLWWAGFLPGNAVVDAGELEDAGAPEDAGTPDAGVTTAPPAVPGCGCRQAGPLLGLGVLGLGWRRRRDPRA
jgi:hypothetical protein